MSDGPRTHRSYRPGDWFGIFGDRTTVLLPPGEKARVPALWQLLDDGAGFDEALDALVAGGLRGLPGFVLLSEEDGTTRIVVRGAARARLSGADGELELEGSDAATWVERTARGVTRVVVQVSTGDDAGAADPQASSALRIDGGLARVSRVDQPPYAGAAVDVLAETVAPADDDLGGADAPDGGVFARVEATAGEEPVAETSPAYDDEETQAIAWAGLPAGDTAGDDRDDPDGPGGPDHPDDGRDGDDEDDRVTERLAGDGPPRPVARLQLSTGEVVEVDRLVLVGRAPDARRFADAGERPRLVVVDSPHQEISATHLEVRPGTGPDAGVAVLTDLGSTNGTWLVQPGREAEELRAGLAERLLPGAVVDLGDGVTIRVLGG
jgi:hypothetical protein